jgi:hypothetical protein
MAHNIAVREQKLRLGFGISAENSFQRFERRGLVPALLINPTSVGAMRTSGCAATHSTIALAPPAVRTRVA